LNSYSEIYVHIVWATWNREPLITQEMQIPLYACIADQCRKVGAVPLEIGGVENHVHVLVRYPATLTVPQLAHDMKGASSHLIRQRLFPGTDFRWQGSYGARSVDPEGVPVVRAYIRRQPEHHAEGTMRPEWERAGE
jgi:putative transposase